MPRKSIKDKRSAFWWATLNLQRNICLLISTQELHGGSFHFIHSFFLKCVGSENIHYIFHLDSATTSHVELCVCLSVLFMTLLVHCSVDKRPMLKWHGNHARLGSNPHCACSLAHLVIKLQHLLALTATIKLSERCQTSGTRNNTTVCGIPQVCLLTF